MSEKRVSSTFPPAPKPADEIGAGIGGAVHFIAAAALVLAACGGTGAVLSELPDAAADAYVEPVDGTPNTISGPIDGDCVGYDAPVICIPEAVAERDDPQVVLKAFYRPPAACPGHLLEASGTLQFNRDHFDLYNVVATMDESMHCVRREPQPGGRVDYGILGDTRDYPGCQPRAPGEIDKVIFDLASGLPIGRHRVLVDLEWTGESPGCSGSSRYNTSISIE